MITEPMTSSPSAVVVGDTELLNKAKPSLTNRGLQIESAPSWETASGLFRTININLAILDLKLNDRETNKIVNEIRRVRPGLKLVAISAPRFNDVLKENFYRIAKDVNDSVTSEQIEDAIKKVECSISIFFLIRTAFALICITGIFFIGKWSRTPLGEFLGTFWATALGIELAYYSYCSRRRLR